MAQPSRQKASDSEIAAVLGWSLVVMFIMGAICAGKAGWALWHDPIIGLVAPVLEQHQVAAKCVTTVGLSPKLNATVTEAWPCSQSFYKPKETAPLCHARRNLLNFKITSWDRHRGEPACEDFARNLTELIAGILMMSLGVVPLAVVEYVACREKVNAGRRIAHSDLRNTTTRTAVIVSHTG